MVGSYSGNSISEFLTYDEDALYKSWIRAMPHDYRRVHNYLQVPNFS